MYWAWQRNYCHAEPIHLKSANVVHASYNISCAFTNLMKIHSEQQKK